MRALPLVGFVLIAAGCHNAPAEPIPKQSDEPTRLVQTLAAAIGQRDSLTLARFLASDFVVTDRRADVPPISREGWLNTVMKEVTIDSVSVRDVSGRWSGDTLITESWVYARGKAGDGPVTAQESRYRDRWLLSRSRWQWISREMLESRAVGVAVESP